MSNILFITTSPTVNGNGDTLTETALNAAKSAGANGRKPPLWTTNIKNSTLSSRNE